MGQGLCWIPAVPSSSVRAPRKAHVLSAVAVAIVKGPQSFVPLGVSGVLMQWLRDGMGTQQPLPLQGVHLAVLGPMHLLQLAGLPCQQWLLL